jgi:hypothetical protein
MQRWYVAPEGAETVRQVDVRRTGMGGTNSGRVPSIGFGTSSRRRTRRCKPMPSGSCRTSAVSLLRGEGALDHEPEHMSMTVSANT